MTAHPLRDLVHPSWAEALEPVADEVADMGEYLRAEVRAGRGYLPDGALVLRAFTYPLDEVRVLVVGQDPYPTPGHPIGLSFAVDPADPDRVVAATPEGPRLSTDGGRTWTPLAGAPALAVLAWPAGAGLFGVAVDGTVHTSSDGGTSWTRGGTVGGEPEALTVDARDGRAAVYAAVAGKGIVASTDGGRTFAVRYAEGRP